jgi:hypothetical protein
MPLAHNSAAPGAAALWAGAVATLWWNGAEGDRGRRGLRTLLLTAAPALVAVALLGINYARHGSPFVTGYHVRFAGSSHTFLQAAYIPRNLAVMARWMAGTPWLAPALALALAAAWCNRGLRLPIGLALAAQTAFWLCYRDLHITTTRYLLPLTGLFALGLPRLGEWLEERYPGRGPAVALALFLAAAASGFFWDDWFRPFFYSTLTGEWRCCTWYMSPQPDPTRLGSAVGPVQGIVLAALLASGGALLARAWRAASRWDRSRTAPGTP